ncbi:MAG: hypothetical protein LKF37_08655 [Lentilactobacillus diolivorans]|jgi:hypothetical protein|nr:hypothetical protein [Lentilactobacillus diolivorans]
MKGTNEQLTVTDLANTYDYWPNIGKIKTLGKIAYPNVLHLIIQFFTI